MEKISKIQDDQDRKLNTDQNLNIKLLLFLISLSIYIHLSILFDKKHRKLIDIPSHLFFFLLGSNLKADKVEENV